MVVIDVLRAFTTAAYAFGRGAHGIYLVAEVDNAFGLRRQLPHCLLTGEVNGLPIVGFDFPNSPSAIEVADLSSVHLIQRTTAGTQGAVLARGADHLFAASLCVATATARRIKALDPEVVTFVETGVRERGGGEEDTACADYIESVLLEEPCGTGEILSRVRRSKAARKFCEAKNENFPRADLDCALQIDKFSFAMKVAKSDDTQVLRSIC